MGQSRTFKTKAITLDKTKLGESDLIFDLLSSSGELLHCVGRGARKPGSRLAARCDLFSISELMIAKGRSLDVITDAKLIEAPLAHCFDMDTISCASVICDIAKLCSYPDSQDSFIFAITQAALHTLGGLSDLKYQELLVVAYIFKLLSHIGYRPDYDGCIACGDEAVEFFSAQAGGLLCSSCAQSIAGATYVDQVMQSWLTYVLACKFSDIASVEIEAHTTFELLKLAHSWAATHLDARIRSLEFMLGY